MREWSQDGDVENNARKTLPERPQRSHWKFNTKYTSKYTTGCGSARLLIK
jgi:hypothetical protein